MGSRLWPSISQKKKLPASEGARNEHMSAKERASEANTSANSAFVDDDFQAMPPFSETPTLLQNQSRLALWLSFRRLWTCTEKPSN